MTDNLTNSIGFTEEFAFAIALGEYPPEHVCDAFGVDAETYERLQQSDNFNRTVREYQADIKEKGVSLQMKAKITLEMAMPLLYTRLRDPETPANAFAQIIDKLSDLAGAKKKEEPQLAAATFQLVFANSEEPKTIDVSESDNDPAPAGIVGL